MRLKVTYIFIFISEEIKRGRSLQEINKERKGGSIKKERVSNLFKYLFN